ncbi:procyclic form-specific polypeptide-like [Antechinus flavipes]|uniref:procyclic form-specific polypeptide-like n=1 Tax=Antechinus flavipes TaxID=38775 RepID=UPI002236856D|nr:procyclic form-specific polypeptide-like [Antechinus flavipes]
MTDGERKQPLQPLASDEVRVPIASVQAAQPGEEEEEDAASGSKSLQGSVASGASSAREREQERECAPEPEPEPESKPAPEPEPEQEPEPELGAADEEQVPYPALAATVFFCLKQTSRPRSWCLRLVCNPYPSLLVHMPPWGRYFIKRGTQVSGC